MAVLERCSRVRLERLRARDLEDLVPARLVAPSLDVDQIEEPPFRVGQEDRARSIRQPEEALDGRERLRIRGCFGGQWSTRAARILRGAQQQHAGGNRSILVTRE